MNKWSTFRGIQFTAPKCTQIYSNRLAWLEIVIKIDVEFPNAITPISFLTEVKHILFL